MPDDKKLGSKILGLFIETDSKPDESEELMPEGQSAADMVARGLYQSVLSVP